jgi:hypothetical protein
VALLIAWSPRVGFIYASVSGVLLAWVYLTFVTSWSPVYSAHREWPLALAPISFVPWAVLVWVLVLILRRARKEDGGDAEAPPPLS